MSTSHRSSESLPATGSEKGVSKTNSSRKSSSHLSGEIIVSGSESRPYLATSEEHNAALNLLVIRDHAMKWTNTCNDYSGSVHSSGSNEDLRSRSTSFPADLSSLDKPFSSGFQPPFTPMHGKPGNFSEKAANNVGKGGSFGTNTSYSELKSDNSIVRYYEPKFYELFLQYSASLPFGLSTNHRNNYHSSSSSSSTVSAASVVEDLSELMEGHLLTIALENLISFCCWARESTTNSPYIKQSLDDNPDLRPEVRNGLAMILMYSFASAQARYRQQKFLTSSEVNLQHVGAGISMFSIIQDPELGLGIVNKTSLKIYNDPFNFFNFLKSCISGLIDAGKIPENERLNQVRIP
jgi:hypothetical protein